MGWEEDSKAVLDRIVVLETEREALKKQVQSGEDLIQRHKTEIGQARDEIKTLISGAKLIGDEKNVEKLQKLLDKTDEIVQGATKKEEKAGGGNLNVEKDLAELKGKMTKEQREKAEKVYQSLLSSKDPKQQEIAKKIADDKSVELDFLKTAGEAVPKIRQSLFEESKAEDGDTGFRALFGLSKEASHIPASRYAAASGFTGTSVRREDSGGGDRRLSGGVIPRPKLKE